MKYRVNFLKIYLFFVYVCLCEFYKHMCSDAWGGQRVSDPLELELQAGNLQGTETRSSKRVVHALNHAAISLVSSTA